MAEAGGHQVYSVGPEGGPPPGWYPDPSGGHQVRWWDGTAWTAYVAHPAGETVPAPALPSAAPPAVTSPGAHPPAPRQTVRPGRAATVVLRHGLSLHAAATAALELPEQLRREARKHYEIARHELVREQLSTIPVARLKDTTEGRLRLAALEKAGIETVGAAMSRGEHRLQMLPGIGPETATKVVAASRRLQAALTETVRLRFDPDRRPRAHGDLLVALRDFDVARRTVEPVGEQLVQFTERLAHLGTAADRASSRAKMFFAGSANRDAAMAALGELDAMVRSVTAGEVDSRISISDALAVANQPSLDRDAAWAEYQANAAAYNGLLIEIGELQPEPDAVHGHVPAEIAARINDHPLDTSMLIVSLRGYQAFGAKFALAQRRSVLGDEMGLGKTIEALAAVGHLRAEGANHFLVVSPASVLANWDHEIRRHSHLVPYRLHGYERIRNLRRWARQGGIAITTYDTLKALTFPQDLDVSLLVADEAHYIKNPAAKRTIALRQRMEGIDRILFLTGTPMENRVDEFRTLVDYLQPGVANAVRSVDGFAGASTFRAAVAGVYLRRNQDDVLQELPPRIENDEWVEPSPADQAAYLDAVASGNFMAMRRAAFSAAQHGHSAKLERLVEIVAEAMRSEWKVVVFSYFRDVLSAVYSAMGNLAIGPLTGSVDPTSRLAIVDEFSRPGGPSVLVSQIEAGGVGLNMQAASVVILTEPQWKPSTEDQAIARLHRLGQIRPVHVHRLLAEHTVDQRMLEILAPKRLMFDEYVRRSDLKDATPDAVDISSLDATQEVASQAEAERRIIEMERRRLGLADTDADASINPKTRADTDSN